MDHYTAAESLLARAAECDVASIQRNLIGRAQAHATLATVQRGPVVQNVDTNGAHL